MPQRIRRSSRSRTVKVGLLADLMAQDGEPEPPDSLKS
jgi:hypothetical protein